MPKFLVEALSQYRMLYVVEAETAEHAKDSVALEEAQEFGQDWLGEAIMSSREVDQAETLRVFDEINDYLSGWSTEQKLRFIEEHSKVKKRDE